MQPRESVIQMEILIIEPNSTLLDALRDRLTADGYTVTAAETGTDALRLLDAPRFDAVLLDWMMPDMDGISVLRELRTRALDTPVMLLSTRTSVADRVLGLDSGADDYLIKPFHMDECMARVRRLVRPYRRKPEQAAAPINGTLYCVADLTVDPVHHVATRGGKRLALSAKECAILEYMACNQNMTLTQQQIETHISPEISESSTAIVPVYIHYLRRKVDAGYAVKLLHTVRGGGYMLSAEYSPKQKYFERIRAAV